MKNTKRGGNSNQSPMRTDKAVYGLSIHGWKFPRMDTAQPSWDNVSLLDCSQVNKYSFIFSWNLSHSKICLSIFVLPYTEARAWLHLLDKLLKDTGRLPSGKCRTIFSFLSTALLSCYSSVAIQKFYSPGAYIWISGWPPYTVTAQSFRLLWCLLPFLALRSKWKLH